MILGSEKEGRSESRLLREGPQDSEVGGIPLKSRRTRFSVSGNEKQI